MQNHWTKDDVAAAWKRFERTYAHDPVAYRFVCGHCIQDETDEDALDYNIIGVWLVCHRKYRDWSTEKSYDLAWILEFIQCVVKPLALAMGIYKALPSNLRK